MDTPPGHEAPSTTIIESQHYRPDAKTQRYDRQLRLWAASGQAALESAHVLVITGSALATSTLKNLVLPGVGAFTILDDAKVAGEDLGNNFFLQPGETKIGDLRAEQAAKYLSELNDGVKAQYLDLSVTSFLESSPEPLAPYSIVICAGASPTETLPLADACWSAGVPMISVRNSGFIASVRTQMQEAFFIETHPDQEATTDLRLFSPWPELEQHALSVDFSTSDTHEHAHIPPLVILLKVLDDFKKTHEGRLPQTYAEKKEIQQAIREMKKGGVHADEENFEDAVGMVIKAVQPTEFPSGIKNLFKDPACEKLTDSSPPFWILLRALRDFVNDPEPNNGASLLPLVGNVPDMKATSTGFAKLVLLFRTKAKQDMAIYRKHLSALIEQLKVPEDYVSDEQINVFVKNAAFVQVIRGRKMRDEYERPQTKQIVSALKTAAMGDPMLALGEGEEAPTPCGAVHFYLALRAADIFNVEYSRWPGSGNEEEDPDGSKDLEECLACAERVLRTCTGDESATVDESLEMAVKEIVRGGGADLPQIAALIGGVVAQEAIKIITKQYVPLNGTWVLDGMKSMSESFNF